MSELQHQLTPEEISQITQGIKVPTQPQIMVDLQMEQLMPDPDLKRIAQLISQDVGLSGTTLKIVNSPFYGLSNKITSIEQAVSLLGHNSIVNILNGLSIRGELTDDKIKELTGFWDTATDIAMVSATLANKVGINQSDQAYALGLFHNVGVPLMYERFSDYMDTVAESYNGEYKRTIDLENQRYKTNHCVVGYYVAKSWNLPSLVPQVIAEHHSATSIFARKDGHQQKLKSLLGVLKLAEHLCGNYKILGQQEVDHEWEACGADVLEFLGLTNYDVVEFTEMFADMGLSANAYSES